MKLPDFGSIVAIRSQGGSRDGPALPLGMTPAPAALRGGTRLIASRSHQSAGPTEWGRSPAPGNRSGISSFINTF